MGAYHTVYVSRAEAVTLLLAVISQATGEQLEALLRAGELSSCEGLEVLAHYKVIGR